MTGADWLVLVLVVLFLAVTLAEPIYTLWSRDKDLRDYTRHSRYWKGR